MDNLDELLGRLARARVEFVLVGAYAAIVHGASVTTRDLDVCMPFVSENLFRLRDALGDIHPVHRMTPKHLPLELNEGNMNQISNLYLATDLGPLDCLSEIVAVGDYKTVLTRSIPIKFAFGDIRVLDIDALVATKSHLMRLQDKLIIPQLLAIKERQCVKSS